MHKRTTNSNNNNNSIILSNMNVKMNVWVTAVVWWCLLATTTITPVQCNTPFHAEHTGLQALTTLTNNHNNNHLNNSSSIPPLHHDPLNRLAGTGDGHVGKEADDLVRMERYPVAVVDFERVQTPFIIGLWIFLACLGKIGFHMTPKISHMFPESCMLIVLGVIIGLLLIYTQAATVSPLTADVFFLYLLPPIILDAGYFMPNRLFFDHLFTILVFAVVGTIWNALTIGISMYAVSLTNLFGMEIPVLHMFLFSSLISAVDPVAVLAVFEEIQVEEVLYILVFGESLLNDGVTVVLYHLFEGFSELGEENIMAVDIASGVASFLLVALGGTAIGIIWGFLTAFVTRLTSRVRVIEPIFVFVMAYLAYLNAEIFHFSGILSITFCGITMKNYVEQNISPKSHTTIKYTMKMLASSSETIIFMFLGVSTIQSKHDWNTWFVILTIFFCSIYRILGVLIFSAICNRFRVKKIDSVDKFVMSYGGLRGAVAFALVITINPHHIPLQPMFLTATIAMVYFTVFVQGITIKPLVELLGVKKQEKRKVTMNERLHERVMDYIIAGIEDVVGKQGNQRLRNKFKRFNNKYLTPFLVREKNLIEPKLFETYANIRRQEAMERMHNGHTSATNIESFANLLRNAATHPHLTTNNQGEWNLDVAELDYKPTQRDMNDAKFHHLLSTDYKPVKRHRGSCYKRHAVTDDEMQTTSDITHHNMYRHTRQFVSNIKRANKTPKRAGGENKSNGTTDKTKRAKKNQQPNYQQNGSAITLKNDYMAKVVRDNPAFENDDGSLMFPDANMPITEKRRQSTRGPVMAETALPWKRYYPDDDEGGVDKRKMQRALTLLQDEEEGSQPTIAEAVLPWKRPEDEEVCDRPVKQNEFPGWASNKEYVNYYSPSNTFLGQLSDHQSYPNIREIFQRRSSTTSLGSKRGSVKELTHQHPMALKERSHSRASLDGYSLTHAHSHPHSHSISNPSLPTTTTASNYNSTSSAPSSNTTSANTTTNTTHHHPPHLVRQRTSTDCSLLNTVIVEEERRGDTVIDMAPDGGQGPKETTKM